MKFWQKLAQVFLGIFVGYWISQLVFSISFNSGLLLAGLNISGGGASFVYWLMGWGLLLIGTLLAFGVGVIINYLLIAFLPLTGVVSSLVSLTITLWKIIPIIIAMIIN